MISANIQHGDIGGLELSDFLAIIGGLKGLGRGGELRDARTAKLTLAGNDLKPYAPVQILPAALLSVSGRPRCSG